MVKKFAVGVALLLMSILVAGCGVPQEYYDTVVAEADAIKTQIPSLENDLSEAQSEADKAETDLASLQDELATTRSDLEAAQSELDSAEGQASSAENQVSSLQSQVSSLQSDIGAAQSELDSAEATIVELEAAIGLLKRQRLLAAAEPKLLLLWSEVQMIPAQLVLGSGAVKNISDESLSDVEVVVYAWDEAENRRYGSALIDKNPLLPGETSGFTVSLSSEILFKWYNLYFRFLDGDEIPFGE